MKKAGTGHKKQRKFSFLYIFFRLLSLLPLRLLYCLSDILAFITGSVVRYRRKVVLSNLKTSFPEKENAEIERIAKGFYRYLCDYFMETVKLSGMGKAEIMRRMRFEGLENLAAAFEKGQSVVAFLGHYGNWEWISSIPLHLPEEVIACQIYHELENRDADTAFLRLRERFGSRNVKMEETFRVLYGLQQKGILSITGFIADQAPGLNNTHLWVNFLNHDTPVFTGGERMARRLNTAVFYFDIFRPRRGEYICRIIPISPDASKEEEFSVTRRYFQLLEENIRRCPELWLWSHRRWKRTREDFNRMYGTGGDERLKHLTRTKK